MWSYFVGVPAAATTEPTTCPALELALVQVEVNDALQPTQTDWDAFDALCADLPTK